MATVAEIVEQMGLLAEAVQTMVENTPAEPVEPPFVATRESLSDCIKQLREHGANRGVNLGSYSGDRILQSLEKRLRYWA